MAQQIQRDPLVVATGGLPGLAGITFAPIPATEGDVVARQRATVPQFGLAPTQVVRTPTFRPTAQAVLPTPLLRRPEMVGLQAFRPIREEVVFPELVKPAETIEEVEQRLGIPEETPGGGSILEPPVPPPPPPIELEVRPDGTITIELPPTAIVPEQVVAPSVPPPPPPVTTAPVIAPRPPEQQLLQLYYALSEPGGGGWYGPAEAIGPVETGTAATGGAAAAATGAATGATTGATTGTVDVTTTGTAPGTSPVIEVGYWGGRDWDILGTWGEYGYL